MTDGAAALTHDLIRLRESGAFTADEPVPGWVDAALRRAPWVVVRRGFARDGWLPVGVRGATREERFAGWVVASGIEERLSPEELAGRCSAIGQNRRDAAPALSALVRVAPLLACRGSRWGPGGSVGFELATGVESTTAWSDLDVILRQARRMARDDARELQAALADAAAPARIDVLLETPRGGVALAELAAGLTQVAVRMPDGLRMMADPWQPGAA